MQGIRAAFSLFSGEFIDKQVVTFTHSQYFRLVCLRIVLRRTLPHEAEDVTISTFIRHRSTAASRHRSPVGAPLALPPLTQPTLPAARCSAPGRLLPAPGTPGRSRHGATGCPARPAPRSAGPVPRPARHPAPDPGGPPAARAVPASLPPSPSAAATRAPGRHLGGAVLASGLLTAPRWDYNSRHAPLHGAAPPAALFLGARHAKRGETESVGRLLGRVSAGRSERAGTFCCEPSPVPAPLLGQRPFSACERRGSAVCTVNVTARRSAAVQPREDEQSPASDASPRPARSERQPRPAAPRPWRTSLRRTVAARGRFALSHGGAGGCRWCWGCCRTR